MRLLFVVFTILVSMAIHAEQRVSVTIEERDAQYKVTIQKAGDLLLQACPGILAAWPDLESARAQFVKENYQGMTDELYGWKQAVIFTFVIKNDTRIIPDAIKARGHTIEYILGAGTHPGIVATKTQGQLLCGKMQVSYTGSNMFLPVEDMKFMNGH